MRHRNVYVWATVVAGTVVSLWACTRYTDPTGPTSVSDAGAGERLRGLATVGPTPRPVGPSARPIGPSARPIGPTSAPVGPSPRPVGPSTPPSGGGGGGGGTPPPPTPTPTPSGCAQAGSVVIVDAADQGQLPYMSSGGNFVGPVITIDANAYPNCTIRSVSVQVAATATDLMALGTDWVLRFDHIGGPIGFDLIHLNGTPLVGTALGSSCGALTFADGGMAFANATAPYDGTFIAYGDTAGGSPGFQDYIGTGVGGEYGLYPAFINDTMTITCYRIQFELQ